MTLPWPIVWRLLGVLCVLWCGCPQKDDRKPVFPARGQVFYEGQPTPRALVILYPLDEADSDAPRPRGRVETDGTFRLSTYLAHDGGPAGRYAVTVTWRRADDDPDDSEGVNRLPLRYARSETTPLVVEISPGDNEFPPFILTR
jgi:hypothetical protein